MKDELAETERILEQKVKERTEEVVKQKDEIDSQRSKLEELYTDVTDSIRYAKRLQDSILPPEKLVKKYFPSSFVLFKPKDIVSGDFYWVGKQKNEYIILSIIILIVSFIIIYISLNYNKSQNICSKKSKDPPFGR